jgi:hypothetical protein
LHAERLPRFSGAFKDCLRPIAHRSFSAVFD